MSESAPSATPTIPARPTSHKEAQPSISTPVVPARPKRSAKASSDRLVVEDTAAFKTALEPEESFPADESAGTSADVLNDFVSDLAETPAQQDEPSEAFTGIGETDKVAAEPTSSNAATSSQALDSESADETREVEKEDGGESETRFAKEETTDRIGSADFDDDSVHKQSDASQLDESQLDESLYPADGSKACEDGNPTGVSEPVEPQDLPETQINFQETPEIGSGEACKSSDPENATAEAFPAIPARPKANRKLKSNTTLSTIAATEMGNTSKQSPKVDETHVLKSVGTGSSHNDAANVSLSEGESETNNVDEFNLGQPVSSNPGHSSGKTANDTDASFVSPEKHSAADDLSEAPGDSQTSFQEKQSGDFVCDKQDTESETKTEVPIASPAKESAPTEKSPVAASDIADGESVPKIPERPARKMPVIPKRPVKTRTSAASSSADEAAKSQEPESLSGVVKKGPPPKPKKLSSKIAAFQQMFSQSPLEQTLPKPPVGEREKLSTRRTDFAANLQNVMGRGLPLPGMANPELLRRDGGSESQTGGVDEDKSEDNGNVDRGTNLTRRARGPRGKRLPKSIQETKIEVQPRFQVFTSELWEVSLGKTNSEVLDNNLADAVDVEKTQTTEEVAENAFEISDDRVSEEQPLSRTASVQSLKSSGSKVMPEGKTISEEQVDTGACSDSSDLVQVEHANTSGHACESEEPVQSTESDLHPSSGQSHSESAAVENDVTTEMSLSKSNEPSDPLCTVDVPDQSQTDLDVPEV